MQPDDVGHTILFVPRMQLTGNSSCRCLQAPASTASQPRACPLLTMPTETGRVCMRMRAVSTLMDHDRSHDRHLHSQAAAEVQAAAVCTGVGLTCSSTVDYAIVATAVLAERNKPLEQLCAAEHTVVWLCGLLAARPATGYPRGSGSASPQTFVLPIAAFSTAVYSIRAFNSRGNRHRKMQLRTYGLLEIRICGYKS